LHQTWYWTQNWNSKNQINMSGYKSPPVDSVPYHQCLPPDCWITPRLSCLWLFFFEETKKHSCRHSVF
jgi:hypothetical protein